MIATRRSPRAASVSFVKGGCSAFNGLMVDIERATPFGAIRICEVPGEIADRRSTSASEVFRDLGGLLLQQCALHYSHKMALCQNTDLIHGFKAIAVRSKQSGSNAAGPPRRTVQSCDRAVKLSYQASLGVFIS